MIQNVPENTPIDRTGMSEKLEVIRRAIRDKVEVIRPKSLRKKIVEKLRDTARTYGN